MLKLKLSTKLIGGFMIMGLLLLVGGLVGFLGISQVDGRLRDVSEAHFPGIHSAGVMTEAQITIQRFDRSLLALESPDNDGEEKRLFTNLGEAWGRAEKARKQYNALPQTDAVKKIWSNLKPAWETWRRGQNKFIQLVNDGKREEAAVLFAGSLAGSSTTAERRLRDLSDLTVRLAEEAGKAGQAQASWLKVTALGGTMVGIILALAFGIFFARSITGPINRIIAKLTETSDQFAQAAEQITLSSNRLAEGTSIQAEEVEKTSSVTEELKSGIQQCTDDIQTLKGMTGSTFTLGMEVFEMLKQAKKAAKEIKASSEETATIVKAIEKIAFQTNLLALNASVEAACSGEAGTGFAVVSDDIRNLGMRSTDAVKKAIALTAETIGVVDGGNQFVGTSIRRFVDYGTASGQIVTFTETAAEVAQQQTEGVEQINISIEEIGPVKRRQRPGDCLHRRRDDRPGRVREGNCAETGGSGRLPGVRRFTSRNHPVRRPPVLPARASSARSSCGPRRCVQSRLCRGWPPSERPVRTSGRSWCRRPQSRS
ncbi:MAG: methyl-accepting chemotaxis protein [Deltaproteobacteria bacterium]|nr:methyl-accepting chemotaxis protein [Deltaproteobacteria bacterium]